MHWKCVFHNHVIKHSNKNSNRKYALENIECTETETMTAFSRWQSIVLQQKQSINYLSSQK